MRKVICGFLVAVLLLSVTVLISGTAFADQKNVSVSASIAQSDNKFSMSSSDKVKTFRYGKRAIGSFQISGNINEETTYQGVQAVGLESGTIAFKYNYSGAYLKDSDTSWSIIDDGSKEIDSIKLDSVYLRSSQNSQPNSDTPDMNSRKERGSVFRIARSDASPAF